MAAEVAAELAEAVIVDDTAHFFRRLGEINLSLQPHCNDSVGLVVATAQQTGLCFISQRSGETAHVLAVLDLLFR